MTVTLLIVYSPPCGNAPFLLFQFNRPPLLDGIEQFFADNRCVVILDNLKYGSLIIKKSYWINLA